MISQFAEDRPNKAQEWAAFVETAPQFVDAQEFVTDPFEFNFVMYCSRIVVYLQTMCLIVTKDGRVMVETSEARVVSELLLQPLVSCTPLTSVV